jgi:hypothetical protein
MTAQDHNAFPAGRWQARPAPVTTDSRAGVRFPAGPPFEASGGVDSEGTQRESEPGELSLRQQSASPELRPGPLASISADEEYAEHARREAIGDSARAAALILICCGISLMALIAAGGIWLNSLLSR